MLAELDTVLAEVEPFDLATLEKAVHDYAERYGAEDGRRGQPAARGDDRPGGRAGLYDCLFILGRETCRSRIAQTLTLLKAGAKI